jgi:hypothetical protein
MNTAHAPAQKRNSPQGDPGVAGQSSPAPVASPGNQALQHYLRTGAIRAKLAVGRADDPAEAEADQMAATALRGPAPCACGGTCPRCSGGTGVVHRRATDAGGAAAIRGDAFGPSTGRPLGAGLRRYFEPRFGMALDAVRVHDDAHANTTAKSIRAHAFTAGSDIGFAAGRFSPETEQGRELLAHELAHVAQGGAAVRRQQDPNAKQDDKPADADVSPAPLLDPTKSVDDRVEEFKSLVKTTAVHRLIANRKNLGIWATAVNNAIPGGDIAALAMLQSGAVRPYFEMQDIRDPGLRELRAQQAFGHYRACTGCHIENQLWGSQRERMASSMTPWMSPNEMRAMAGLHPGGTSPAPGTIIPFGPTATGGYHPPAGSDEERLNQEYPDPSQVQAAIARARPIMEALGPNGYRVLPGDLMGGLEKQNPAALKASIADAIAGRQNDYNTLIGKIEGGDLGYENFGPVIQSLLPQADPEVRAQIQDEMDSHHRWQIAEAIIVGIATVAALLLTIFPPTTAFGIAALGALEVGLGAYTLAKAPGMIELGMAYSEGEGADDVFSREQQDSGNMMVFTGFIALLTAPLGILGGIGKLDTAAELAAGTSTAMTAVAGVAGTVQRGQYLITIAEDGSMFVTLADNPNLIIVVRGNTATLYEVLEGGGMRVVATSSVPVRPVGTPLALPAGPGEPPMLPPGPVSPPMLPAGPGDPLMLPPGPGSPLMLPPGPGSPLMLPPGPGEPLMLPPGPRPPLQLGPGNPTTYTWDEISGMRQPNLWQERENYMRELYGASGHQHYPVPGTGGRFVDVPTPGIAGEVKSYVRWIGVKGMRGGIANMVDLTGEIPGQIAKDVWLRDNVAGYNPIWMFTDAPPSPALRAALTNARIPFIVY